jgi:hypothetical protein
MNKGSKLLRHVADFLQEWFISCIFASVFKDVKVIDTFIFNGYVPFKLKFII